jgi:hypothetical protein
VVVLVYIPTNSVKGFLFPRILANTHFQLSCCKLHSIKSSFRIRRGGAQGDGREVTSDASSTICFVLVPKRGLGSDTTSQQRLKRFSPGQEILQVLSRTLPLPALSLGACQHLISPGNSQEQAGLFLEEILPQLECQVQLTCVSGSYCR